MPRCQVHANNISLSIASNQNVCIFRRGSPDIELWWMNRDNGNYLKIKSNLIHLPNGYLFPICSSLFTWKYEEKKDIKSESCKYQLSENLVEKMMAQRKTNFTNAICRYEWSCINLKLCRVSSEINLLWKTVNGRRELPTHLHCANKIENIFKTRHC